MEARLGEKSKLDTRLLYAKGASVHGLWLTYLSAKRELMNQAWQQLSVWTSQGHLHPVIGHVLPMERAIEAYRLLGGGKKFRESNSRNRVGRSETADPGSVVRFRTQRIH